MNVKTLKNPSPHSSIMIRVAINGYGTVGKRVADAVAAQPDMEIVGVSKTRPSFEAYIAKARGFPLYIADPSKRAPFEKLGLPVAGSVAEMLGRADVVVDATPGGVGKENKPLYEKAGVKAIFQGGEDHVLAGFSFCSDCNYRAAMGRQFVRVVSCNTTGLCRIINTLDKEYGIAKVRAVMVRRASDPGEVKKGPVDAVVLDPVTVPSHHGPDVQTVLPHIAISTMAMIVPTTFMHMHAVQVDLKKEAKKERILELIQRTPEDGARPGRHRHQVHRRARRSMPWTWAGPGAISGRTASSPTRSRCRGRMSPSSRPSTRRPISWSRTWTPSAP